MESEREVSGGREKTGCQLYSRHSIEPSLPNHTESNLDQGINERFQLALHTTPLKLRFPTTSSPEGPTPKVDRMHKLPVVDFPERLLPHVLLGRRIAIGVPLGRGGGDVPNTVAEVYGEHPDGGECVRVRDGLVEQEKLG